jgi:hypothetical protein
LLITDESAAEVRPTFDVDVIAEITTYTGYAAFSERLRALGFREDSSKGAPLCCWLIDAIKLDVMPLEEKSSALPIAGTEPPWKRHKRSPGSDKTARISGIHKHYKEM